MTLAERTEPFTVADGLLTDVGGTLPARVLSTPGMIAMTRARVHRDGAPAEVERAASCASRSRSARATALGLGTTSAARSATPARTSPRCRPGTP